MEEVQENGLLDSPEDQHAVASSLMPARRPSLVSVKSRNVTPNRYSRIMDEDDYGGNSAGMSQSPTPTLPLLQHGRGRESGKEAPMITASLRRNVSSTSLSAAPLIRQRSRDLQARRASLRASVFDSVNLPITGIEMAPVKDPSHHRHRDGTSESRLQESSVIPPCSSFFTN
eukprot:scpid77989/ scgid1975/ 